MLAAMKVFGVTPDPPLTRLNGSQLLLAWRMVWYMSPDLVTPTTSRSSVLPTEGPGVGVVVGAPFCPEGDGLDPVARFCASVFAGATAGDFAVGAFPAPESITIAPAMKRTPTPASATARRPLGMTGNSH